MKFYYNQFSKPEIIICSLRHMEQHFEIDANRFCSGTELIHRDLKCLNLLVTKDWSSTRTSDWLWIINLKKMILVRTVGPSHMAPEVLDGRDYDFSADVYRKLCLYNCPNMLKKNFKSQVPAGPNCKTLRSDVLQLQEPVQNYKLQETSFGGVFQDSTEVVNLELISVHLFESLIMKNTRCGTYNWWHCMWVEQ